MNEQLWDKIQHAAINSIENPGKSLEPLPKEESTHDPEIYVFRHGQTFDNSNRVFSGWRDSELTDEGIAQASRLSEKLKNKHIDVCITSPLSRSKDTANLALQHHPDVLFEEDERIIERNYGDLTGHSKKKAMTDNPDETIKYRRSYDFPPPNGESLKMVEERVFIFCAELVERIRKNNINVAISCHGNSMRAIRRYFEKLSFVETLTIENPLGQDYAEYVIKKNKREAQPYFTKQDLDELTVPNESLFEALED